jgi:hypothetical protein
MCGEMVRATLDGTKTQTRRIVKPQPEVMHWQYLQRMHGVSPDGTKFGDWRQWRVAGPDYPDGPEDDVWCPYGSVGTKLWVRETWRVFGGREYEYQKHKPSVRYRADDICGEDFQAEWRPSIHMPRWASRLMLEITEVRVERVQDISDEDCRQEGITDAYLVQHKLSSDRRYAFRMLWDDLNAERGYGWDKNPWCWCISFKRL